MYVVPVTVRYRPVAEHAEPTLWPPACAGRGVTFVLLQEHTWSPFTVRTTRRVTGAAHCTATGEWIPAMAWTAEMEQAFLKARKTVRLAPASTRLQRRFVRILAVALAVAIPVLGAILWAATRPNPYELAKVRVAAVAAAPAVGDLVQAQDPAAPAGTLHLRWFIVRAVTPEAVALQAAPEESAGDYTVPDLGPDAFTGPSVSVPRAAFLADGFLGAPGPMCIVLNAQPADARAP